VQFPAQPLPLIESGQLNIMTNYRTFINLSIVILAAVMSIATHFGVEALDRATAEQCKAHDWPVAAHQIHMDWCATNGYATN
jgi:hypothetical protein